MIYLLRHGETIWNTLGRFQGQKDSPLTKHGIEQANLVATLLIRELKDECHSLDFQVSPLGRTMETADRLKLLMPLRSREDSRLMEVTVGSWDGMTKYEIDTEFPGALDGSDVYDWYFRSPNGETFDDACSRAKSWISDVQRPTIALSHGLFGRIVRGVYAGLSRREMLELPVPQDGFYVLRDGTCTLIDRNSRTADMAK
jgi:probable phosphoglycerate mutase